MSRLAAAAMALLACGGCSAARPDRDVMPNPMRAILDSDPRLRATVARAPELRLQAVLGTIEAGEHGRLRLVQHGFRTGAEYFYPASTVKLFAAIAALEHAREIARSTGLDVGPDTTLVFHPLFTGEAREETTLRREIRKLFLVSDNESFNRLYELVGQDGLAASMSRAGIRDARIVHRLSERRSAEENRRYPRIDLEGAGFVHTLPERSSAPLAPAPPLRGLAVGRAWLDDGARIDGPMDFSTKNVVPLVELQRGLCKLARPDVDCGPGDPYALAEEDRALALEAMSQLPRESEDPIYDPAEFPDEYVKFILPGLRRSPAGRSVTLYDKTGQAYGFTTENAYVVDRATGRGFFLAATIYTNSDGVLNDDAYDYDEVALPFFAALGEAVVDQVFGKR